MEMSETQIHILVNAVMSACGFVVCYNIIPKFKTMFINAHLFGIDMSKRDKKKMWVLAVLYCEPSKLHLLPLLWKGIYFFLFAIFLSLMSLF